MPYLTFHFTFDHTTNIPSHPVPSCPIPSRAPKPPHLSHISHIVFIILFVPSKLVCYFLPSQIVSCVESGKLKDHQLEKKLADHARAVTVRRSLFERRIGRSMENLPAEVREGESRALTRQFDIGAVRS